MMSALGHPVVLDGALEIPATSVYVCAGSNTPSQRGLASLMASAGTSSMSRTSRVPSSLMDPLCSHT